jgi:hypothetical protein
MATDPKEMYNKNANIPDSLTEEVLIDYVPHVSQEDIDRGYMIRYFVRQANHIDGFITEVAQSDYESLKTNHFYVTLELHWRITGPLDDIPGPNAVNTPTRLYTGVTTANSLALNEGEKVLPGIKLRLRNPTAYYIFG